MFHIIRCIAPILAPVLLLPNVAFAQPVQSPKYELRGVFLTTTNSLDWPKSSKADEQRASLREIVRNIKAANLNTIFFQVRARGDAYYKSDVEPWAENLTGTLGKDPGWDPLQFLLDEAHAVGIEVHAWFNVYKVRGPISPATSTPRHVLLDHPEWCVKYQDEWWLDPGKPEVRSYLVALLVDLTQRYDIDGICYDFIRYPGMDFPDAVVHLQNGNGKRRDDWRRSNINTFVEEAYAQLTRLKPMLKVGSAPLGNVGGSLSAQPNAKQSAGGPGEFYQDAREWLKNSTMDYLVPQVYWALNFDTQNADFGHFARLWQKGAAGRHIYVGIGAFKPDVHAEITDQIASTRVMGSKGQVYFRYENVSAMDAFGDRYAFPALLPPMSWKDSIPPNMPQQCEAVQWNPTTNLVRWKSAGIAIDGDSARSYIVYRSSSPQIRYDDASAILATTHETRFLDRLQSAGTKFYYAVTALDKTNNESLPAVAVSK